MSEKHVKSHKIVECSNCDKPLVEVLEIEGEGQPKRLKALCPYCDSESFKVNISSLDRIAAIFGLNLKSVYDIESNGQIVQIVDLVRVT